MLQVLFRSVSVSMYGVLSGVAGVPAAFFSSALKHHVHASRRASASIPMEAKPQILNVSTSSDEGIRMESLWLAICVGTICLFLQGLLTLLFAKLLPDGWWRRQPGFLAHQVIALPFMCVVAYIGTAAWFSPDREFGTAETRVYGREQSSEVLCSLLFGALVLWDIPLTFLPTIYSHASMGHHVGLAALTLLSLTPFLQYYVPFFAGVIEISSIPLQAVDFFHPKHFADVLPLHPALGTLNHVCRGLFILSFIALRTVWFPYVIFAQAIPDLISLIPTRPDTSGVVWLLVAIAFALGFTALQFYWSVLLFKQVAKALKGGGGGGEDKSEEHKQVTSATPYQLVGSER